MASAHCGHVRRVLQQPDVARHERGGGEAEHLPVGEVPRHDREHRAERLVAGEHLRRRRTGAAGRPAGPRCARRTSGSPSRTCRPPRPRRRASCPSPGWRGGPARRPRRRGCRRRPAASRPLGERGGPVAPERRRGRGELLLDLLRGERVEGLEQLPGGRVRRCDRHGLTLRRDAARRSKPCRRGRPAHGCAAAVLRISGSCSSSGVTGTGPYRNPALRPRRTGSSGRSTAVVLRVDGGRGVPVGGRQHPHDPRRVPERHGVGHLGGVPERPAEPSDVDDARHVGRSAAATTSISIVSSRSPTSTLVPR